jgi:hypothetical protein
VILSVMAKVRQRTRQRSLTWNHLTWKWAKVKALRVGSGLGLGLGEQSAFSLFSEMSLGLLCPYFEMGVGRRQGLEYSQNALTPLQLANLIWLQGSKISVTGLKNLGGKALLGMC